MKEYDTYIFDLYGTLIDIHTDENDPKVWTQLAEIYNYLGCDLSGKEIHKLYMNRCKDLSDQLGKDRNTLYPEIDLRDVFVQIYNDVPHHELSHSRDINKDSEWIANVFRILSRKWLRPFADTLEVLDTLRKKGKHVYLLSNAQAVFTRSEIEQCGLIPYLEAIYLSSDYEMRKPEVRFMETLLDEQKVDREKTVMIGDSIDTDITIAYKCSIDGLLINRHHLNLEELNDGLKPFNSIVNERCYRCIENGKLDTLIMR